MSAAKVAVVGVGHSKLYRRAEEPLGKLAVDAAKAAIADAGLAVSDIDAVATTPAHPAAGAATVDGVHKVSTYFMITALGIDPSYADEHGGLIMTAFNNAAHAVATGTATYALVFRALHNPDGRYGRAEVATTYGNDQWFGTYGSGVVTQVAQEIHRYMKDNGGTKEDLGRFVVRNRNEYGLKNEMSWWRSNRPAELTLDDYLNDRMISYPLSMLDCDLPIQGAGAFVLTSAERARDLVPRPAYLRGLVLSPEFYSEVAYPETWQSQVDAGRRMAKHLYANAGITAADIDVANLYDGFSSNAAMFADSMGLSEPGGGLQWVADPTIPFNTSGGNLGNGRLHGVPHIMDGAMQVMGRSGERQVEGAEISLVGVGGTHHAGGLVFSSRAD